MAKQRSLFSSNFAEKYITEQEEEIAAILSNATSDEFLPKLAVLLSNFSSSHPLILIG